VALSTCWISLSYKRPDETSRSTVQLAQSRVSSRRRAYYTTNLAPLFLFSCVAFYCGSVDVVSVFRVCFEWWSRGAGPRARRLSFPSIFVDHAPTCNTPPQHLVSQHHAFVNMQPRFTNRSPSRLRTVLHATRCSPTALSTCHRNQGPTALNSLSVRPPGE
jgi:hypothetical protein